jgi:hypothetical protein
MSEMGHSRHSEDVPSTSGLLPKADKFRAGRHALNLPIAVVRAADRTREINGQYRSQVAHRAHSGSPARNDRINRRGHTQAGLDGLGRYH